MKKKAVFVIGPESSGSMLCAKICAHVLNIAEFGTWSGVGRCLSETHRVIHRSIPYGLPPRYPDLSAWIDEHQEEFACTFILTTRDQTLSEISRTTRFPKPQTQIRHESQRARQWMHAAMQSGLPFFIFSYESFLFLRKPYLDLLYDFLGVRSDFIPELRDANRLRIAGPNESWLRGYLKRLFRRR